MSSMEPNLPTVARIRQTQQVVRVPTRGKSLHNITASIREVVEASQVEMGLCSIFVCHTSASLLIQENADPDVLQDLETFFSTLVPEGNHYRHNMEGPDDMPAHIKAAMMPVSLQIPVAGGRMALGTWQGIYLFEHRDAPKVRQIAAQFLPA